MSYRIQGEGDQPGANERRLNGSPRTGSTLHEAALSNQSNEYKYR
jgi:hypothetical protein